MFRFGVLGRDAYGTTRNTSLTFSVTLKDATGGANTFASSGTITITVGASDFKKLGEATTTKVDITLSGGGSIKKYDKEKTPTQDNLKDFTTGDPLNKNTKLDIKATGQITGSTDSEVTIKATITVSSNVALGTKALTLAANTKEDPSSTGLTGTITPQGSGGNKVEIQTDSKITLTGTALEALQSLTKNSVTLSGASSTGFKSSASITVTTKSDSVDFTTLTGPVNITNINGTIKNSTGSELQTTGTPLTVGTQLVLEATGNVTHPPGSKGNVNLRGTVVVTNKEPQNLPNALNFNGGPNGTGVVGSLKLENEEGTPKHVKIQANNSNLTIDDGAYKAIKEAPDTTPSSFTIGAADPRDATKAQEAGDLNNEESFTKYWHLLPSDNYTDPKDLPDVTVISPSLMVIIGMGFVYCIYPGIAPGMIVPFYLVDKIETVLLVLTTFPPVIIAILQKYDATKGWSPKATIEDFARHLGGWKIYTHPYGAGDYDTRFYRAFDILMITKMTLLNQIATATSDPVTQATLDLSDLTSTHTLKFQNSGGSATVQEVKVDVTEQKSNIDKIKGKTNPVNINLTLTLAEVTLTLNSNTLTATGTITTTKTVAKSLGDNIEEDLKKPHQLNFTSSDSTLTQRLGPNTVTIGPNTKNHKKLNLEAQPPSAGQDGRTTNLKLELKAGTKQQLTLDSSSNKTLQLSGGIAGQLEYDSSKGNLTATRIDSVSYDLNDFHCTYKM